MAKVKNKRNSGLSDKVHNKRKNEANKKQLNPFEVHINREKIQVLGKKSKHDRGLPGVSRAKAIQKRKETIGTEMKLLNKTNTFIDRRIGEKNSQLSSEDRLVARFAAERARQHTKKNIFNLADDEILTHRGQTLEDIEKFDDPRSSDEEEDNDGRKFGGLDDEFVSEGHFGGGVLSRTDSKDGAKSHKDLIEQLIAESKKRKAEKQKEKELTLDMTEKLDTEWKDLQPVVFKRPRLEEKPVEEKSSLIDKLLSKADTKGEDYDKTMRELRFEKRGTPSDGLKNEQQLEREERSRLEDLERQREMRMNEQDGTTTRPTNKHRSADDLDDNFELDDGPNYMLSYDKDGNPNIPEHIVKQHSGFPSSKKFDNGYSDTSSDDDDDTDEEEDDDDDDNNDNDQENNETSNNSESHVKVNVIKVKDISIKKSKLVLSSNSEVESDEHSSDENNVQIDKNNINSKELSNYKNKEEKSNKSEADKNDKQSNKLVTMVLNDKSKMEESSDEDSQEEDDKCEEINNDNITKLSNVSSKIEDSSEGEDSEQSSNEIKRNKQIKEKQITKVSNNISKVTEQIVSVTKSSSEQKSKENEKQLSKINTIDVDSDNEDETSDEESLDHNNKIETSKELSKINTIEVDSDNEDETSDEESLDHNNKIETSKELSKINTIEVDSDDGEESSDDESSDEDDKVESSKKGKDNYEDLKESDQESECDLGEDVDEQITSFFSFENQQGDNLKELLEGKTPKEQSIVLEKLIKKYDPSLSKDNKEKLNQLYAHLLQYLNDTFTNLKTEEQIKNSFTIFDKIAPRFYELAHKNKFMTKKFLIELITEKRNNFLKKPKIVPDLDTLVFFKLVSLLYPTSDFKHPVVTPCFVFMSEILHQCNFNNTYSISRGIFIATLLLEYTVLSKKLVPAKINFLRGIIYLCANISILNPITLVPPFKLRKNDKYLNLESDCSKMAVKTKMAAVDFVTEIADDNFKIRCLMTCVDILKETFDYFNDIEAQEYLFKPHLDLLDRIDVEWYPGNVAASIMETVRYMKETLEVKTFKPLMEEKKRPKALRLYEPDVLDVFTDSKSSKCKSKADRDKLKHKLKKEMKGALREIRRDKSFIASVKIRQKIHSDNIRKDKVKQIYKDASIQQGELNKLKRIK